MVSKLPIIWKQTVCACAAHLCSHGRLDQIRVDRTRSTLAHSHQWYYQEYTRVRLRTAGMKLRFFLLLFSAVSPSQLLLCILVVQLYSYVQQLAVQLAAYS